MHRRVTRGDDADYDKEEAMKALLVGFTILFAIASPVLAQQAPPPSEKTKEVEALVTRAAALIDKTGKAAFAEFRKKDSDWFHGNTYVFVYDLQANVLLNPAFPEREGTNVTGQTDVKGKLFHQEIIRVAQTGGSGWVDYMFPKPGQTVPSQKWTFVKKVTIDGTPGLVAAGFFPD
jgi:cytochrome c